MSSAYSDANATAFGTAVRTYLCPSDPTPTTQWGRWGANNYQAKRRDQLERLEPDRRAVLT